MNVQTTHDTSGGIGLEPADDCCRGRRTGDEAGCCGSHGGKGDKCCKEDGRTREDLGGPAGSRARGEARSPVRAPVTTPPAALDHRLHEKGRRASRVLQAGARSCR